MILFVEGLHLKTQLHSTMIIRLLLIFLVLGNREQGLWIMVNKIMYSFRLEWEIWATFRAKQITFKDRQIKQKMIKQRMIIGRRKK
jgi:hypothetical protein